MADAALFIGRGPVVPDWERPSQRGVDDAVTSFRSLVDAGVRCFGFLTGGDPERVRLLGERVLPGLQNDGS
jgi:hypothetical protein